MAFEQRPRVYNDRYFNVSTKIVLYPLVIFCRVFHLSVLFLNEYLLFCFYYQRPSNPIQTTILFENDSHMFKDRDFFNFPALHISCSENHNYMRLKSYEVNKVS